MIRIIPALAATLCLSAPAAAAPAMWEISDADSSIFIFGSFHVLPDDVEWRTPLFDDRLEAADKVVFEADISPLAMAQIGAQAMVRGIYVDGTLLTDVIDDDLEANLRDHSEELGVPVGTLLAMKPWMAANTISVAAMVAAGFAGEGVELLVEPGVPRGKLVYLETGEEQLDVIAGAPEDEQLAMLESTLLELDQLPKIMSKMISHWQSGTPERIAHLFQMEIGGYEEAFLDRLLYQRNRNWIAPLSRLLNDNEAALVIVGAAHLVGPTNVVELLESKGFTARRVQ